TRRRHSCAERHRGRSLQRALRSPLVRKEHEMTSFKSFRNRTSEMRASQPRANGDSQPTDDDTAAHDGDASQRTEPRSTATEMGPQHIAILRQIESEGEPLTLAEEVAELTDRGDLEKAAEALEL